MSPYNRGRKQDNSSVTLRKRLELDAIAWKGGVNYGKFAANLTSEDKDRIVEEYVAELKRREIEKNRLLEQFKTEAALKKQARSKPRRTADAEEMCG